MNSSRLQSPYEHLTGEDQDLGDGLFTSELYFWAGRKRQQNLAHVQEGHTFCRTCKNCLCGLTLSPDFGFKCICGEGKAYVSPYRIRFQRQADKDHAKNGHVYCLAHHIYESRGPHADATA